MNIAIRVDSSLIIGTGHVMRCLTLAEELRDKGVGILFICREHPGNLCEMLEEDDFRVVRLDSGQGGESETGDAQQPAHASWLGVEQASDAKQTIAILQGNAPWDWVIVDHYALDYRWESAMRSVADKIMVIDDLADRKHDCELVLDQNYFPAPETRYHGLLPEKCKKLFGPEYALLRSEFRQARAFCRMRGNGIVRVLVYFGGNDPDNLTGMALKVLGRQKLKHLLVDAVVGPNNPHLENLKKQAQTRHGTRLHIQPASFVELMLRADFCIGAGGTTTWERLCLGLPSQVISTAANQVEVSRELSRLGRICYLGHKSNVTENDIFDGIFSFMRGGPNNSFDSCNTFTVDGCGSERVVRKIMEQK